MKEGKLIVCATPIGNLEDASPRLARTLAEADLVACEDTRQTRKLLTHLGVTTRMTSYHEVGEKERAKELAERVAAGLRLALVSDAGMPAVSDPGYHLVAACLELGVPVEVVPGPSAALAALVVSGCRPTGSARGVPAPPARPARPAWPSATEPRTMVFFEAPHRVPGHPGRDGGGVRGRAGRGGRPRAHQAARAGAARPLGEVRAELAAQGPRGELTLVVGGVPAGGAPRRARPTWPPRSPPWSRAGPAPGTPSRPWPRPPARPGAASTRPCSTPGASTDDASLTGISALPRKGTSYGDPEGHLLTHHPDLLHQRPAAHRPRLHHHRGRRAGALASCPRGPGAVPHRDRRARPEGGPGGRGRRARPAGLDRPDRGAVEGHLGRAGHRLRRLHPHHRGAPRAARAAPVAAAVRPGRRLPGQLRGPVLCGLRAVLQPRGAGRRQLPDPRHSGRHRPGGELLLPHLQVRRPAAGALPRPPGVRPPRDPPARGRLLRRAGAPGPLHLAVQLHLGGAHPLGPKARHVRLGRRAPELPDRCRLGRRHGEVPAGLAGRLPLRGYASTPSPGRRSCSRPACPCL